MTPPSARRRSLVGTIAAGIMLAAAAPAEADSGSITNIRNTSGARHEATFTATVDACPPSGSCYWYPHATEVPSAESCSPSGAAVWLGNSSTAPGTQTHTATFFPRSVGDRRLCLYIDKSTTHDDILIAQTTYAYRPAPVVQVTNSRRYESTTFDVSADEGVRADIFVGYRNRLIRHIVRRNPSSFAIFDPVYYYWSCRRLGTHQWVVVLTHEDGSQVTRTGRFRVPGRCGPWRYALLTAGFASNTAARGWSPEFVSRVRCQPRGRRIGSWATAWGCIITHNNSFRVCETFTLIRQRVRMRFGARERKLVERAGRSRCRSF